MKVKELIEYLKTQNQEMQVIVLEQMVIGLDADIYPVNKTLITKMKMLKLVKQIPGAMFMDCHDILDEDEILVLNNKINRFAVIDEEKEEEEMKEIENRLEEMEIVDVAMETIEEEDEIYIGLSHSKNIETIEI